MAQMSNLLSNLPATRHCCDVAHNACVNAVVTILKHPKAQFQSFHDYSLHTSAPIQIYLLIIN